MADGHEHAVGRDLLERAGRDVSQPDVGDALRLVLAQNVVHDGVPAHRDVRARHQPLDHDLLGAEGIAPVHDGDVLGEMGEVERLLDRRIAAADHEHRFAAEEEAVAGRAGRDAEAPEGVLARQVEPFGARPGRQNDGVGQDDATGVAAEDERPALKLEPRDILAFDPRADMLGLGPHLLHQPRPLDRLGEARIVLDVGGDHQLAAGLETREEERVQHGARGVDGGRVACRPRADDDDALARGSMRSRQGDPL